MPVTTRRRYRGLLNPSVIGWRSEDSPTANFMREIEDDDDPMDGSITGLSASEDDEDYVSMGNEHESVAFEGESNHEEINDAESDDDFEGMFNAPNGHVSRADCIHSKTPCRQTSQAGESRERVVIETSREDKEDWVQPQGPGPTAEHAVAALRRSVFGTSVSAKHRIPVCP